jgi:hypothetical protein
VAPRIIEVRRWEVRFGGDVSGKESISQILERNRLAVWPTTTTIRREVVWENWNENQEKERDYDTGTY